MSQDDDWVELSGEILADTERAVRFSDGDKLVWLPRSLIRPSDAGLGPAEIECRYWLAMREGLI
jgi:hypothetical protein